MLIGSLAGFAATVVMTSFMARMHQTMANRLRYELPPREIIDRLMPSQREQHAKDVTLAAHFGFGSAAGALLALLPFRSLLASSLFGMLVWTGSYLGWIPLFRILRPATAHPAPRNALMIAAHAVWGLSAAIAARELRYAADQVFSRGSVDRPEMPSGNRWGRPSR